MVRIDAASNPTVTVTSDGDWKIRNTVNNTGGTLTIGNLQQGGMKIGNGGKVSNGRGTIANGTGSSGTVTVSGLNSAWENSSQLVVGRGGGKATLDITDGGKVSNTNGTIGNFQYSNGEVTVSGKGSLWQNANALQVGNSGKGKLDIKNGGKVSNTDGYIADAATSESTVTVDGEDSLWQNTKALQIGNSGTGKLDITNGGKVSNTNGTIGNFKNSNGKVTVDGEGSQWQNTGKLVVGNSGEGSLNITNKGQVAVSGGMVLGQTVDGSGNVVLDGAESQLTVQNGLFVGGTSGKGSITVENGAALTSDRAILANCNTGSGQACGGVGTVSVSGKGSTWKNSGRITVGNAGTGELNIKEGGVVSANEGVIDNIAGLSSVTIDGVGSLWENTKDLYVGSKLSILNQGKATNDNGEIAGKNAQVLVSGEKSQWQNSGDLQVGGFQTTGSLTIENGGQVSNQAAVLGFSGNTSKGTATVSGAGSVWQNAGTVTIGQYMKSSGELSINDGAKVIAPQIAREKAAGSSVLNFNGGILQLSADQPKLFENFTVANTIELQAGGGTIDTQGNTVTVVPEAVISGSGNLKKQGTGALILANHNTYGGGTTIEQGTLQVGDGGTTGTLGKGDVVNNGTLVFNRNDDIAVAQPISGTGNLTQKGAGTVVLTANNTYGGNTTIEKGTLQVGDGGTTGTLGKGDVVNNGTLAFNRSDDIAVAQAISGTGNLKKQGAGVLSFNSNKTYTGNTDIEKGTLRLADTVSLSSAMTSVSNGATLDITKTATLQGLNNHGTLKLDNAAASVLQVNGDFTTDGSLRVKVADMGTYSKIAATGNVTLGGTLDVDAAAATGLVKDGVLSDVVKGASRTGEFASVKDNSTLFNFIADYKAKAVDLKLAAAGVEPPPPPLPEACKTVTGCVTAEKQWAALDVARVLDKVIQNQTNSALAKTFIPLSSQKAVADAAVETLPLLGGADSGMLLAHTDEINIAISEASVAGLPEKDLRQYLVEPKPVYAQERAAWGKVIGGWDKQSSRSDGSAGYSGDRYGFVVGAHTTVTDQLRLGGALSYIHSSIDSRGTARHHLSADSWQVMGYGDYALTPQAAVDFRIGGGRVAVDGERYIGFSGQTAKSDFHADIFQAGLGASYRIGDDANTVAPFVRTDYTRIKTDAYSEKDAGALNLNVQKHTLESLNWQVGMHAQQQFGEKLVLKEKLSLGIESMDTHGSVLAEFAGAPGDVFVTTSTDTGRVSANIGLSAGYRLTKNIELGGQYAVQFRKHYTGQGLGVYLKARF